MDKHALHIFYVRHGVIMHESPEFESFKRLYSSRFSDLEKWLNLLESVCRRLDIKLLQVNGGKLLKYITNGVKPTVRLVVSCLERPEDTKNKNLSNKDNLLDSVSSFQSHQNPAQ